MQHSYLPIVISFLNHVEKFFHDPTSQSAAVCEIFIFHFILLILFFLSSPNESGGRAREKGGSLSLFPRADSPADSASLI